ncbi:MAG: D-alanyl-D-alanine carboxypeptidase [Ferruginibacter sp.]
MRTFYLLMALLFCKISFSQDIKKKIDDAMNKLAVDEQFKHSILSMYLVDGKTGKVLYDKNSEVGLAPASCQKIVTSVSAFEILGKDFTYQTEFGYNGVVSGDTLQGNLYIVGNGDPTFGSWRWKQSGEEYVFQKLSNEIKKLNIKLIRHFIIDNTKWGTQGIPDGWVWEDIGQYYGAGCGAFNWNENQYNIVLRPGKKVGDSVAVLSEPPYDLFKIITELTTAAKGTGDQVYVYSSPYSFISILRGTAPLGIDSLTVAAAGDAEILFQKKIVSRLYKSGVLRPGFLANGIDYFPIDGFDEKMEKSIYSFISPTFDSINYWFLKKSINLYGEAFVKTIAYQKTKVGSTDSGVNVIRDFWSDKGIEKSSLKIIDGSGLSPANRLTTNALVTVLQYAKNRPWFSSFYNALPEMNGIKMKDGYIGGVRSYTGYVKSASGAEYSFAFIVNNFDGNPATVREKMWRVLDLLK